MYKLAAATSGPSRANQRIIALMTEEGVIRTFNKAKEFKDTHFSEVPRQVLGTEGSRDWLVD